MRKETPGDASENEKLIARIIELEIQLADQMDLNEVSKAETSRLSRENDTLKGKMAFLEIALEALQKEIKELKSKNSNAKSPEKPQSKAQPNSSALFYSLEVTRDSRAAGQGAKPKKTATLSDLWSDDQDYPIGPESKVKRAKSSSDSPSLDRK